MNKKIIVAAIIIFSLVTSCGKKSYSVEDVLSWHGRHFNNPVLDSLGYEQLAQRNDYVMIDVKYNDSKLRFIIDKESTLNDFEYYRCLEFDSTSSRDIEFPIESDDFRNAEERARKVFSYYLKFEKIEFTNYENPDTIFGGKKIYFRFGENLTLVYSPNGSEKLIKYFSITPLSSEIIRIDNSWFIFSK